MRDLSRRWPGIAISFVLVLLASGCSQQPPPAQPQAPPPPPEAPKTIGRIMFGKEPVQVGRVKLYGEGKEIASALVFPDGSFEVTGVPPGEYQVALDLWAFPVAGDKGDKDEPGAQAPPGGGPPDRPHPPPGGGPDGPKGPRPHKKPLMKMTPEMKARQDRIDRKYADPVTAKLPLLKVDTVTIRLEPWILEGSPEKPGSEKPGAEKPGSEKPAPEKPGSEKPAGKNNSLKA